MCRHPELTSLNSDPECILPSATLHKASARSKLPTNERKNRRLQALWESPPSTGNSNDANGNHQGVQEQQMELECTPEYDHDFTATVQQAVIPDEVKSQVAKHVGDNLEYDRRSR